MSDECRDRAIDAISRSDSDQFQGLHGETGLDPGKPVTYSKADLIDLLRKASYVDFLAGKGDLRICVGHYEWYEFQVGLFHEHRDPWTPPKFW